MKIRRLFPEVHILVFDWGDTVMRDFPDLPGPMADWEVVELIPGAKDLLMNAHRKYTCVIATNAGVSDTADMIRALKRVEVHAFFQYFFSSRDLGYEKPDIRFFQGILSALGCAPNECLMIGNSYEKDIVGARNAGMHTAWLCEQSAGGSYPMAEVIISDLRELI